MVSDRSVAAVVAVEVVERTAGHLGCDLAGQPASLAVDEHVLAVLNDNDPVIHAVHDRISCDNAFRSCTLRLAARGWTGEDSVVSGARPGCRR